MSPKHQRLAAVPRRFTALGYLAKTRSVDEILSESFDKASNLTERFAAYRIARSDGSDGAL